MNIVATAALLQLCFSATASVSDNDPTETLVTAEPGDAVVLPCYTGGNGTPSLTMWTKDGREVGGARDAGARVSVHQDGSLKFREAVSEDRGSYLCSSTLPDGTVFRARALLQITSAPSITAMHISWDIRLPNGTLIINQGTPVSIHCEASSSPSQQLSLTFSGAPSGNNTLNSTSRSSLDFRIEKVQRSSQGVYTCSAVDTVSNLTAQRSAELLVYNVPDTHPDCMWVQTQDLSRIQLNCSWFGAYPPPKLRWGEAGDFLESDNLSVVLNGSRVTDGQKLKCTATHQLLKSGLEKSCLLTLKAPFPEGDPLAAAIEGTSVTLTCTETTAAPPANTTWTKGLQKSRIETGSKYVLSDEGPSYKLTILNVTKDDEGCFFCLSENQLGVKVLEVCLTVKTSSSAYTGGIIGVFIAALIVGSAVVVAKLLYSRRHEICLGGGFGDEDTGDVLSLVDSDDEQIFQDTVPQLPPVVNGRHLTLVEVHRIPSSDHDETEPADRSPQQPEDTEEPE
ncbi:V-set and immunoglobulin domain-containing protein 10 isoform X1 [Kryptolebias marmoratus]|uniref:V-set and immunoglobulin domain containing 10 n=1 Tax=Kryptolebias marmoratus TaxID=37003 RepID=A0A3Q2ZHE9_KRYMA|nr:V-set and immunoglobulin domain-containing protein 10 isoform X1 [Kryptolebias marmoratus]